MIRVHIICEGQTEEVFVRELLVPSFITKNIHLIPALVGKPGHKGGNIRFERLLIDIRNRLNREKNAYCTTFIDYYGLPPDFPGKSESSKYNTIQDKASCVNKAMTLEIESHIGLEATRRFIPYVQMYEFEALLFSDPEKLAQGINRSDLSSYFNEIRTAFDTPEDINDSPQTAPSKRIKNRVRNYEKPLYGTLAALEIGLIVIRQECPLFNQWSNRLENLG